MAWTSEVAICNGALTLLGAESIVALTDTSKQGVLCARWYEQTRDACLRGYPWNFAVRRARLNAPLDSTDADAPVWGFTYGFTLPSNCLRVLETDGGVPFRVEGRVLYSDDSSVDIRYIMRVTDVAQFDPQFSEALAAKLAMVLAYPLTKSSTVREEMATLYSALMADAENTDTQEGTADDIDDNALIEVRGGNGPLRRNDYW